MLELGEGYLLSAIAIFGQLPRIRLLSPYIVARTSDVPRPIQDTDPKSQEYRRSWMYYRQNVVCSPVGS